MSSFTKTNQTSSKVEQKPFVVPNVNNGRWQRVARRPQQQGRRPQQQVRQQRRPQQQGSRPQLQGRQQRRPQFRGRQNRRPYNNRRRNNYRKKNLGPQKGTRIATGSLLDMAMVKNADGSKSVKVQSSHNGKRVIKHALLKQVLTKKDVKKSNNSFAALDQPEIVRKVVPRPTVIKRVIAPKGKWGAPLSNAVKEESEFKYESGSQLEKKHMERLAELEEERLAEQELDRQIRTGEYKVENWADEMDSDDEDDFQDNRELGQGSYDRSFQPDVDDEYDDYVEDFDGGLVERSLATAEEIEAYYGKYNHQAEIQQLDGWYD